MNCNQANKLPLDLLLISMGVVCTKNNDKVAMFLSPFREEQKSSFKVDKLKNVWHDHGPGIGGTVVDLIVMLNNCDTKKALNILRGSDTSNIFSFQKQKKSDIEIIQKCEILKICRIQKPALISYLHQRNIDVSTAKKYCKELHYSVETLKVSSELNETKIYDKKPFFTIAIKNDKDGYETRNKIFKGCLIAKAITTINNGSDKLNLFEGFLDFLSYLTLMPKTANQDFIITNSTAIVKNTIELLPKYNLVKTFFDNDSSGLKATELIENNCKDQFLNESLKFKNHKDVNDYLMSYKR